MRQILSVVVGIVVGLATLLGGQLAIEAIAWWWTSGTEALDTPLLNGAKFAIAGTAALVVGAWIAVRPVRRSALL